MDPKLNCTAGLIVDVSLEVGIDVGKGGGGGIGSVRVYDVGYG